MNTRLHETILVPEFPIYNPEPSPRFCHPNNLEFGKARLIWAEACHPVGRDPLPEGWAIPGGARITDRSSALEIVATMDALSNR